MGWKCHAFTGSMGQPSTFNDFNKSYSRCKREDFCDSSEIIFCDLYTICMTLCMPYHDAMRICMHAMPRPLSVIQETIIIVLYYSVQSEVSAVRKPESPLFGSFFVQ